MLIPDANNSRIKRERLGPLYGVSGGGGPPSAIVVDGVTYYLLFDDATGQALFDDATGQPLYG